MKNEWILKAGLKSRIQTVDVQWSGWKPVGLVAWWPGGRLVAWRPGAKNSALAQKANSVKRNV